MGHFVRRRPSNSIFGHGPWRLRLNGRNVFSRWSTLGKSLEEEHWIGDRVTHRGCTLAQEHRSFRKSGRVVEGSRTGLTLDKHLNDKNSDRRPRRFTESNRKALKKGIESPTVLDVGNTEALRGGRENVTGRSCRSFGNPAKCDKEDPILFPLYYSTHDQTVMRGGF